MMKGWSGCRSNLCWCRRRNRRCTYGQNKLQSVARVISDAPDLAQTGPHVRVGLKIQDPHVEKVEAYKASIMLSFPLLHGNRK